jgi:hypothetical protein
MLPAGFEPAIPATERPQTHAFDGAATGIGGKAKYPEYPEKTQSSTVRGRLLTIVWGLHLEICMKTMREAMTSLSEQEVILQNTSAPDRSITAKC